MIGLPTMSATPTHGRAVFMNTDKITVIFCQSVLSYDPRRLLTDGRYNGRDEVERSGEVPSGPELVHEAGRRRFVVLFQQTVQD